ncbi:hypothetical protein EV356DRAFT_164390 [Viridothelium virens]|uniref:F-box domain-containing protein n=1 Tax=Viridothelium virens TaxID=1048519 RepID=A0A6A6HMV3_VIRVR|nr:hypothetical protein EV356DRAFT_164390 [Viridothelium virens]
MDSLVLNAQRSVPPLPRVSSTGSLIGDPFERPSSPCQDQDFEITSFEEVTSNVNHFARVPPELRAMIFRELLKVESVWYSGTPYPFTAKCPRRTAIMRTCRTFHEETAAILYGENYLGITLCSETPLNRPYCTFVRKVYVQSIPRPGTVPFWALYNFLDRPNVELAHLVYEFGDDWHRPGRLGGSGEDPSIGPWWESLLRVKRVRLFDIVMPVGKPCFKSGHAEDLKRSFLSGRGPPGRRIRFFVPEKVLKWHENGRSYELEDLTYGEGLVEISDLAVCEDLPVPCPYTKQELYDMWW